MNSVPPFDSVGIYIYVAMLQYLLLNRRSYTYGDGRRAELIIYYASAIFEKHQHDQKKFAYSN